jgi:hypothetical protein
VLGILNVVLLGLSNILIIFIPWYPISAVRQSDQVKEDEMGRACSTHEEKMNAYRVLMGRPEGTRSLGISRRRWEDNIKMDLREIGWGDTDWTSSG